MNNNGKTFSKPYKVGELIALGAWGGEPIEWRVLGYRAGRMLLISERGLDAQPFNKAVADGADWEASHLKHWLETEFGPKAGLTGTPFCLSAAEARRHSYFRNGEARACQPTAFAKEQGADEGEGGHCWWWLSSAGFDEGCAAFVTDEGGIIHAGCSVDRSDFAVRPALWVDL